MNFHELDLLDWFFIFILLILTVISLYISGSQLRIKNYSRDQKIQLKRSVVAGAFATLSFFSFGLVLSLLGGATLFSFNFWRAIFPILLCTVIPIWIIVTVGANLQFQNLERLLLQRRQMGRKFTGNEQKNEKSK